MRITSRRIALAAMLGGVFPAIGARVHAEIIPPDAVAGGGYAGSGGPVESRPDGGAGHASRDFLVFDLSGAPGPIDGAPRTLDRRRVGGAYTYTIFDATTPIAVPEATRADAAAIDSDPGTATAYGTSAAVHLAATSALVSLAPGGLAALGAADGGTPAIGGAFSSLTDFNRYICDRIDVGNGPAPPTSGVAPPP